MKTIQAIVLMLAVLPAAIAQDTTTKEEGPLLAGTWTVEALETSGIKIDGMGWTMTFADGKLTMKTAGDTMTATYKITPGKPPAIDITPQQGEEKDKTSKCILELTGDQLKICVAKPDADRPKDFKVSSDTKTSIIYLKREKK